MNGLNNCEDWGGWNNEHEGQKAKLNSFVSAMQCAPPNRAVIYDTALKPCFLRNHTTAKARFLFVIGGYPFRRSISVFLDSSSVH